jgi:hypothetical protein
MKRTFNKWFVQFALIATCGYFAWDKGIIQTLVAGDRSYIVMVIGIALALMSLWCGQTALQVDKLAPSAPKEKRDALTKKLTIGWFAAEHFMTLGLLGTCIGFCMMLVTSLVTTKDVAVIIGELTVAAGTALYTTLAGIVASLFLQVQLFTIQYKLTK